MFHKYSALSLTHINYSHQGIQRIRNTLITIIITIVLDLGIQQAQLDGKNLAVKDIMDTWTLQMNYPVVTLTQSDKDNVKVTQTRFLLDRNAMDPGKYASPYE